MSLNDIGHHGQPEARPLFGWLRGKEGLEDSLLHVLAHPASCIPHFQTNLLISAEGPEDEPASLWHGIPGIQPQVHKHLLEFYLIAEKYRDIARQILLDLDGTPHHAAQHRGRFPDDDR